jgi:hypothetical protein
MLGRTALLWIPAKLEGFVGFALSVATISEAPWMIVGDGGHGLQS